MIPLIRPLVPSIDRAVEFFRRFSIASGQLTNFGPLAQALEQRLAVLMGTHVVVTVSGTAAIELALRGIMHRRIKRVLVPDFTHIGTLLAVKRAGMVPVLIGVDPKTWVVRPEDLLAAAKRNAADAAIIVSPFGYEVDVEAFERVSDELAGFPLVYDFAGAFGAFPKTAHPVCYSFHATKNLGACEAGAVRFALPSEAARARQLSNFDTLPDRSVETLDGANQKIDEWRAAMLLSALDEPDLTATFLRIENKRAALNVYQLLNPSFFVPKAKVEHWPSLCVVGGILDVPRFAAEAAKAGITVRSYYPLISMMPAAKKVERWGVSPSEMATTCALPSDATIEEIARVSKFARAFLGE